MERPNGGFGRGNGHTIRTQQPVSIERPIPMRHDDEWSNPHPVDDRRNGMEGHLIESMPFPAAPPYRRESIYGLE